MNDAQSPLRLASEPRPPKARWVWVSLILLPMAVSFSIHGVMVAKAVADPGFVAEPDYYQQAAHWRDHQAQERVDHRLGWQVAFASEPAPDRARTLRFRLNDRAGVPLTGAALTVLTFHKARADQPRSLSLREVEPGIYEAELPRVRPGRWEVRLEANRAGQLFTYRADHHLPPGGA